MLKDTLYKILLSDHGDGIITATLELDIDNVIFAGHFPAQPVLPGACMLQMVKDVLESTLDKSLMLKQARQIKFLELIDPRINSILELTINYMNADDNTINVSATLNAKTAICFKFTGNFIRT